MRSVLFHLHTNTDPHFYTRIIKGREAVREYSAQPFGTHPRPYWSRRIECVRNNSILWFLSLLMLMHLIKCWTASRNRRETKSPPSVAGNTEGDGQGGWLLIRLIHRYSWNSIYGDKEWNMAKEFLLSKTEIVSWLIEGGIGWFRKSVGGVGNLININLN